MKNFLLLCFFCYVGPLPHYASTCVRAIYAQSLLAPNESVVRAQKTMALELPNLIITGQLLDGATDDPLSFVNVSLFDTDE